MVRFPLHDISKSGMGFILDDPAEYEIGEKIEAVELNKKPFPEPLLGEVKSVRDVGEGKFKVGVLFIAKG